MNNKFDLSNYVASIPNFPKEGILFRDITPILESSIAFKYTTDEFCNFCKKVGCDVICGPESRGFIFGTPVAVNLGVGFVPVRKPGKLPRESISVSYDLEYGSNVLCMHKDSIKPGQKVVIIDDLLATGGTMNAAIKLVEELGGIVTGLCFVIELDDLKGRNNIDSKYPICSLLHYEGE